MIVKYRFSNNINQDFSQTLKKRVFDYFKENDINKNANTQMVYKTFIALLAYFVPYLLIISAGFTNIFILFFLWIFMGFGKAFIGTSIMHDALHGSYTKKKYFNKILRFSAIIVGADPKIWQIQHNVLHHTYTNIEHADEDIHAHSIFRFTPNQPKRWFHNYQHFYALLLYSFNTLVWITSKDFVKLFNYRKKGLIKPGKELRKHLWGIIVLKLSYYAVFLILPILLLEINPIWVILMFISMHMVTGLLLSLIFQSAHVMPTSNFIDQKEEYISENWSVHQIQTTSNFAMNNKLFSWLFGSLNFQVEHHLFPNICHVHYPQIAKIVQETTHEFGLPYHYQNSFRAAILNHFKMLKMLGRA